MFKHLKSLVLVGAVATMLSQAQAVQPQARRTRGVDASPAAVIARPATSSADGSGDGPICHDGPGLGGGY
jgi:hypothetical protein